MAWNRFAYVYNNPVNYTDPSGHIPAVLGAAYTVVDTAWDAVDLYSDVRDCLGDSDSMACYMAAAGVGFIIAGSLEGPSNNVARRTAKAGDAGEGVQDVAKRSNRLIPGTPGTVTGGSSTKLGKNLLEEMELPRSTKWSGYQAQHIIPSELADHPVLVKIGMDLDDPSNGLFLRVPDGGISPMARHRGYHSVYNEAVERALNRLDIAKPINALEYDVFQLQQKLKYLQLQGTPLYPSRGATVELWERLLLR